MTYEGQQMQQQQQQKPLQKKMRKQLKQGDRVTSISKGQLSGQFEWIRRQGSEGIVRRGGSQQTHRIPLGELTFLYHGSPKSVSELYIEGGGVVGGGGGKKRKQPQDFHQGERVISISKNKDLVGDFEWIERRGRMGRVRRGGSATVHDIPLKDLVYNYGSSMYKLSPDQDEQDQDQEEGGEGGGGGGGLIGGVSTYDPKYIKRKKGQNALLFQDIKKIDKPMQDIRMLALDDFDQKGSLRTMTAFKDHGGKQAHYHSPNLSRTVVESVKVRGGNSQQISIGQYMSKKIPSTKEFDGLLYRTHGTHRCPRRFGGWHKSHLYNRDGLQLRPN